MIEFKSLFKKYKDNCAIIWKGNNYNYSYFLDKISEYRNLLNKINVLPGCVVMLSGDFSPNCISMIFALIDQRVILVPINNNNKNNLLLDKLNLSKAEVIIDFNSHTDECTFKRVGVGDIPALYKKIIMMGVPGLVLFSSGSTGEPKVAVHNFSSLLQKYSSRKKQYKTVNFLLFDHWGGLNTMFHVLANGGTVVAVRDRTPTAICKLIQDTEAEILPVTPTFLNLIILSKAYEKYNLSSLKIISYGAEPMPEFTLNQVKKIFPTVKILQTYGLIEVGVLNTKSDDDGLWVKLDGDGYQLRVVDGCLEIKSKSTILGYLNAEVQITKDGWFKTGDMVEVKNDKYKILGRKSELINIGGEKVHPIEIENIIKELKNIADVTVYSEKNKILGNILCADISIIDRCEEDNLKLEIKRYCMSRMERYKVPIKINIIEGNNINERFKKLRKK